MTLELFWNPYNDDKNMFESTQLTQSGTFHLDKGDVVYVSGIPNDFYGSYYSTFSGFLITPD